MIVGMCDPDTQNVLLNGRTIIVNPYGHIPARMYGIFPFTKLLVMVYTLLVIVWLVRCCWYRKELMSVHIMVTTVLGTFLFDVIVRLINLYNYNEEGEYTIRLTMFSLIITSLTHTVARCLTIMIAKGLGVSKATLGNTTWKIVVVCIAYFCLSLWDSIITTFSRSSEVNMSRVIATSIMDSLIYFWILKSLLDTIQELEDKKQTGKLDVFLSLRTMIIIAVIISTVYNMVFSYLIMQKKIDDYWKYQWFFNDGIWSLFYLLAIIVIMVRCSRVG